MKQEEFFINNWTNNIQINGILSVRPQFTTFEIKGRTIEKCQFVICQNWTKPDKSMQFKKFFVITTFSKEIIKELKELEYQCVINVLGMMALTTFTTKEGRKITNAFPQATEIKITNTFIDKLKERE